MIAWSSAITQRRPPPLATTLIKTTPSLSSSAACSHVRFQGAGHDYSSRGGGWAVLVRTAGDRTRRRRLNKLSCAGWVPHDRGSVSGLPRSKVEHRSGDRLITGTRVPHRGPVSSSAHSGFFCGLLFASSVQQPDQTRSGWVARAIAQMKPTISRAMAVVTTTFGLPAAVRRRYLAHRRTCAFQAMSRIAAGSGSRRS